MRIHINAAVLAALALAPLTASASAQPASPPPAAAKPPPSTRLPPKCFYSHDWAGWKPSADSKSIYIRVGVSDFYRIDFSDSCPTLRDPDVHLVTRPLNDLICSPIELDLKVAQPPDLGRGMAIPCIVTGITPLSHADMAALPKKLLP